MDGPVVGRRWEISLSGDHSALSSRRECVDGRRADADNLAANFLKAFSIQESLATVTAIVV